MFQSAVRAWPGNPDTGVTGHRAVGQTWCKSCRIAVRFRTD